MTKLKMRTKRRLLIVLAGLVTLGAAAWWWLFWDLPHLDQLSGRLSTPSVRILDRNGALLYEMIPADGGRHQPVPLDQIPHALLQATVATEDQNFYKNPGVDLSGILRAIWINLQGGETLAGGSTITQQVAKNLLLDPDERLQRTARRKLRESWLAWQLARQYSKDEILAIYLNQTYYGGLAYGVEAAAQTFFGKPASQLDLAEAALIAGLPQAPAIYNPLMDPQAAINRQQIVLELMFKQGLLSQEQLELAQREPLVFSSTPYPIEAPHFSIMVEAEFDALIPAAERSGLGSLTIHTTLDLNWQHLAEHAILQQLENLAESGATGFNLPGGHNVNNAALVALDPHSGAILALIGSPDYFDNQHAGAINMAISPRQPGSSIKPIVYAAAFDVTRAQPWTAATMILDVSTTFMTYEGKPYTPVNYDGREYGPVLARQALASSLNIPAVATLDEVGLPAFAELAQRMGISTLGDFNQYDLSLALGGGEVTLLELSAAYAVFANQGYRCEPYLISAITDSSGNSLYQYTPPARQSVLDARVAWLISDILSDPEARSLGFGTHSTLRLDRPAAVKTGTTTNFHDNWTVGYTPELVVGVWVGNTNHEPMYAASGLTGAAPIWHQFLRSALTGTAQQAFPRPQGLVQVEICKLSGLLPSAACPYRSWEWFIDGTQPNQADTFYRPVLIDARTGRLADANTPPGQAVQQVLLDLPPAAHAWARKQGLNLYVDLQSQLGGDPGQAELLLQIQTPGDGAIFHRSESIDPLAQRLHLSAIAAQGITQVSLWLDGALFSSFSAPPYESWWQLEPGEHSLWAEGVDENGETLRSPVVRFSVVE